MNEKEQIQMAFTLWEQLAKTENLLWDRYYKEFLKLIIEKQEHTNDNVQEFVF